MIPIAFGFAAVYLTAAGVLHLPALAFAGLDVLGYGGALLIARRWLKTDRLEAAAGLVAHALVLMTLLGVPLLPFLFPALLLIPIAAVALALPYLAKASLRRLMVVAFLAELAAVVIDGWFPPLFPDPPVLLQRLVLAVAATAATALTLRLLWVDSQRLGLSLRTAQENEERTRQLAERFRQLTLATTQIVWTTDPRGVVLEDSGSWRAFTGTSLLGSGNEAWVHSVHPDDREPLSARWQQALQTSQPFAAEVRLRRVDGQFRHCSVRVVPVRDPDGTVREWVGVHEDIHERRMAAQVLLEERETIGALNRLGPTLAAELDLKTLVQSVTDAATDLTGAAFGAFFYNLIDARGESYTLYTLSGVSKDSFEQFPLPRATELFGPTFRGEAVIRIDDVRKDPRYGTQGPHHGMPPGHLPVVSYLATPVKNREGKVLGGLFFGHPDAGVFTERSEQLVVGLAAQAAVAMDNAHLFELIVREKQRVEEANRAKDEFLSVVSHELRTPLSAILGWARIARSTTLTPEKHARALETIERNARSQAQLIEDLLDISRIITGKLRLEVRPMLPAPAIEAALESIRPAAEAKGLRLKAVLDPNAGPVSGDPDRLQQVVWNLLSNSVRYTPRGGWVQVELAKVHSSVEICVADSGEGIAEEFLPHVFERFRQADSSSTRQHGGLGLGLSIVRHLVELHGGTIEAASEGKGKGAIFRLKLPLSALRVDPREREVAVPGPSEPPTLVCPQELMGARILVVDDEPDARELLRTVFEGCGAKVTVASSASEALHQLEAQRFGVLVSDIGMPGEDGFSLIRRVRALTPAPSASVPAIALTAYARLEDRTRALLCGFSVHAAKPIEPAELVVMVAALLRGSSDASA